MHEPLRAFDIPIWNVKNYTPPMTSEELPQALDALIAELKAAGHEKPAKLLHSALHESAYTTGGEMLGELSLTLDQVARAGIPQPLADEAKKLALAAKKLGGFE